MLGAGAGVLGGADDALGLDGDALVLADALAVGVEPIVVGGGVLGGGTYAGGVGGGVVLGAYAGDDDEDADEAGVVGGATVGGTFWRAAWSAWTGVEPPVSTNPAATPAPTNPAITAAAASGRQPTRRCRRRPGPAAGPPGPAAGPPGPGSGDPAGDPHGGKSGGTMRACPVTATVGRAPAVAVSMLNVRVTGSGSQPVAG